MTNPSGSTYRLFGDLKGSSNWQRDKPFSGISVLIGNHVPGRYAEYQTWYEDVHIVEVANVPGHVAMKRGVLEPRGIRVTVVRAGQTVGPGTSATMDPLAEQRFFEASMKRGLNLMARGMSQYGSTTQIFRTLIDCHPMCMSAPLFF